MDPHARGRSPSAGNNASHLRHHNPSTSPQPPPLDPSSSFDITSANYLQQQAFFNAAAASGQFNDLAFTQDLSQQHLLNGGASYPNYSQAPAQQAQPSAIANHTFLQSAQPNGAFDTFNYSQSRHGSNQISPGGVGSGDLNVGGTYNPEALGFPDFNQTAFQQNGSLDPSLLNGIDQSSVDVFQPQPQHSNRNSLDPSMAATMQAQAGSAPHMLSRHNSGSPSPQASPGFQQAQFATGNRPRNASESLDPSSAAFPQGISNEWGGMGMGGYRTHRRVPSDQLSDISSHSQHNSPYLPTLDSFDGNGHSSPMLNATIDPIFNNGLGLGDFSLADNSSQQSFHTPAHSPHLSPRLMAQQASLPPYMAENNFGMGSDLSNHFDPTPNEFTMFPGDGNAAFPQLATDSSTPEFGNADAMSPPEIYIHSVPTVVKDETADGPKVEEALSPPLRSKLNFGVQQGYMTDRFFTAQSRNRMRAKSDSHAGSRPATPLSSGRGRSPSLQTQTSVDGSLAPFDGRTTSREASPARGRNGSLGSRARSSSNASDHREYILDLANPERTPSNDPNNRRQQKHPATFQCTLCPKRFTRAYNLRSHLRTHTDERPFVCTVCGKAFARQHDRKRHEGLHSGEKKFVCKGALSTGSQWGCGRRFARADALGRHFRSEAGRVCIKPLLDEEAVERQKAWHEEQRQAQMAAGFGAPQMMAQQPQFDMMGSYLPQALLQQFPALANIDWNTLPQGNPPEDDFAGGRSSFDASSGGEYYEDISENEMGDYQQQVNGMGMGQQQQQYGHQHIQQPGDYLNGFEGR
nr:hypothetical protein B0A51_01099 [Rachicladosporium sp. CCFEE 5018]